MVSKCLTLKIVGTLKKLRIRQNYENKQWQTELTKVFKNVARSKIVMQTIFNHGKSIKSLSLRS